MSFLAAVVLFILSVGSVRGFALYLGHHHRLRRRSSATSSPARRSVLLGDTGWLDEGDTFGLKDYE